MTYRNSCAYPEAIPPLGSPRAKLWLQSGASGSRPEADTEAMVPKAARIAILAMGLAAALPAPETGAQTGNLDAGKTPAQIFATTCSGCHRNAREVRRASASFLRSHYTAGREEASAMASYLSSLPAEPKAEPKRTATPAPGQPRREGSEQGKSGSQPPAGQTRPSGKAQPAQTAAARQRQQQIDAEEQKQPAAVQAPAPPASVDLPETSGSPPSAVLPPMEE